MLDLGRIRRINELSVNYNFEIIIDGNYSGRHIRTLDESQVADAILDGLSDGNFSDFCQEKLDLHWYDLNNYNDFDSRGMHSGKIVVKQDDNKIFDISIEDLLDDPKDTINDMAKLCSGVGFYYLRIEWEGKRETIQLAGKLDEEAKEYEAFLKDKGKKYLEEYGWKNNFKDYFVGVSDKLGLLYGLGTESSLGFIDLSARQSYQIPKTCDELLIFVLRNVKGERKYIIGLNELSSTIEKDNVDLSSKDSIMNYLKDFSIKNPEDTISKKYLEGPMRRR